MDEKLQEGIDKLKERGGIAVLIGDVLVFVPFIPGTQQISAYQKARVDALIAEWQDQVRVQVLVDDAE